jgi:hypothetical protein
MTKAVAEAAEAQYWDALADDEFERYERKQRFIDHGKRDGVPSGMQKQHDCVTRPAKPLR